MGVVPPAPWPPTTWPQAQTQTRCQKKLGCFIVLRHGTLLYGLLILSEMASWLRKDESFHWVSTVYKRVWFFFSRSTSICWRVSGMPCFVLSGRQSRGQVKWLSIQWQMLATETRGLQTWLHDRVAWGSFKKGILCLTTEKPVHINVHSRIIHNSPKYKPPKCAYADEWIKNVAYT